ncbi:flagellar protein FliS [Oleidesulfovibrio alaskensis G20]|jgi:flagellar protein FliS|uniref:Flagellar protein FliS n=1 Tax=Oleidesulfovibrio alaskensis (strain ATCC BAA-1058 / DSM 17464 / G20) TaxID=207559 RepID=Q313H6_OLEA2|nr:flagellar export chaperone FliS [Oleidesulfovibrio alaskensis]ABB37920.1 flagellar protein FliS [Oleidesulfovibrio alaskensis G20]MBG0772927.1 flagellar export chaperone FliS [Oleidesulfovibrio alaskensis]MBL3582517.1 flagellar export chaperone FliS [Oleidesulfovibrio alaskensis]
MQKAAHAYFQTQVSTTSQGQLLLMLYDGAIKFLNQAKDKIAQRDYAAKGILISKALDVINELDGSLNPEQGPELAENLHKLYFYCSTRLLNANLKMDVTLIDEVIRILSGLRSAYAQIMDTPEAIEAQKQLAAKQRADAATKQHRNMMPQAAPSGGPALGSGAAARRYGAQNTPASAPQPAAQEAAAPAFPPAGPGRMAGFGSAARQGYAAPAQAPAATHTAQQPAAAPGPSAPQQPAAATEQSAPAPEQQAGQEQQAAAEQPRPAGFGFNARKFGANMYRKTAGS